VSTARAEMHEWKLQEAGAKLDDVVRLAREEGPQAILRDGKREAVVLSAATYEAVRPSPRMSFAEFLLSGPTWPDDVVDAVNERSRDTGRIVGF